MIIEELEIYELESFYNLLVKIREGIATKARINQEYNPQLIKKINDKYNMVKKEIMNRIDELEWREVFWAKEDKKNEENNK